MHYLFRLCYRLIQHSQLNYRKNQASTVWYIWYVEVFNNPFSFNIQFYHSVSSFSFIIRFHKFLFISSSIILSPFSIFFVLVCYTREFSFGYNVLFLLSIVLHGYQVHVSCIFTPSQFYCLFNIFNASSIFTVSSIFFTASSIFLLPLQYFYCIFNIFLPLQCFYCIFNIFTVSSIFLLSLLYSVFSLPPGRDSQQVPVSDAESDWV